MHDSYLLFVLLFFIKLFEELAIDGIEVQTVLALHEAGEHIALEVALELRLRDVAAVCLGHALADVLAPQDLISVRIVPGSLLIIRQASVRFLNLLKLFRGVHVSILIWMPLERSLFVGFLDGLFLSLSIDFQQFVVTDLTEPFLVSFYHLVDVN